MPSALITGASSGIGYQFARLLAQNFYDVVLVARNIEILNDMKQELEKLYSVQVTVIPADLSFPNIAENIVKELNYRKINLEVLINNAGFGYAGRYLEQPWENEKQMLQVNVEALSQLTKLILPGMIERKKGRILNVASTAAFQPGPLMAVYYATKAYVLSYSEALANELKGTGVTVTCLCPGPTATDFQKRAHQEHMRFLNMFKIASAEEVAQFGFKALLAGKTLAIHGKRNKLLQLCVRILPRSMTRSIVRSIQENRL